MKTPSRVAVLFIAAVAAVPSLASAAFVISQSPGTFAPTYRGAANSHYFGWTSGTFDGNTPNGLLDDPEISVGDTTLDALVSFTATPAAILSSSGNIYKNGSTLNASLVVPVPGTNGTGFTTIIVQGGGVGSPYGNHLPMFGIAGGDSPDVAVSSNANNRGQFWAKYEIAGNAGSYTIPIAGSNPPNIPSIAELRVDVLWSPTAFATDSAVVAPEPATVGVMTLLTPILGRRKRRH